MDSQIKSANFALLPDEGLSLDVFWTSHPEIKIIRIEIVFREKGEKGVSSVPKEIREFAKSVSDYYEGRLKEIPIRLLDLSQMTPFQKKVLCELRSKVPRGNTISYSQLAKLAGCPGGARAVGSAMRKNPFPIALPCHRVLKNDGSIGAFMGGREGSRIKKLLLEKEADNVSH